MRGGFGAVLPAAASGARHARRRAWPGQRQRARSMGQPARRERRASRHIVCHLPSILWSTAVNLFVGDQNRRAFDAVYVNGFGFAFSFAKGGSSWAKHILNNAQSSVLSPARPRAKYGGEPLRVTVGIIRFACTRSVVRTCCSESQTSRTQRARALSESRTHRTPPET